MSHREGAHHLDRKGAQSSSTTPRWNPGPSDENNFKAMLALTSQSVGYMRAPAPNMMQLSGLKELAKSQNPVVGYFDPLSKHA